MPPLERNEKLIIDLLSARPEGLTRKELLDQSRLSRPTVGSVIQRLKDQGVVEEDGGGVAKPRRGGRLAIKRPSGRLVGIDLGHKHVRVGVADMHGGDLKVREHLGYDVDEEGPQALVRAIQLVREALDDAGAKPHDVRAIAVGVPGPLAGTKMARASLASWANVDVEGALRDVLSPPKSDKPGGDNVAGRGQVEHIALRSGEQAPGNWHPRIPIAVENDANLGALGERSRGAAQGLDEFLYLKASTGIGLGIVVGGQVYRGSRGAAGEFGHVTSSSVAEDQIGDTEIIALPRNECPICGKLNCLQNLASCDAIVAQLKQSRPFGATIYPDSLEIKDVIVNARSDAINHPLCRRAIVNAGTRLGHALADLVIVVDPERVVIGGILAGARDLLEEPVRQALQRAGISTSDNFVQLVEDTRIERSEVEGAIARAVELAASSMAKV